MKIISRLLLISVVVFSLPSWCIAQNRDGNKLLVECEAALAIGVTEQSSDVNKYFGAGHCLGLVRGIFGSNVYYPNRRMYCAPEGVTAVQAVRIVVKFLQDHPERLHEDDSILAITALNAAFPCTDKK